MRVFFAMFLAASLLATAAHAQKPEKFRSFVTIYDLRTKTSTVLYTADQLYEAPNWSPDGRSLLLNTGGRLVLLDTTTAHPQPEFVALPAGYVCNNDKAFSPNGQELAFSAQVAGSSGSQVFVSDASGRNPRLIAPEVPSYFHGWSPDGNVLALVAQRPGSVFFDIYSVPANGGKSLRLTANAGHNDGPDYAPNGDSIYINSDRSGTEQIWRLPAHAANPNSLAQRVTNDNRQDWFPHPSPDGKLLVYLAYPATEQGHNGRLPVELHLVSLANKASLTPITTIQLFGDQGTINVNSWSPDSTRFAYVSYQPLP